MPYTPELLAPAGDWECLRAAVANGADAVYFGLPQFNARLRADNFTEKDLPGVVAFCQKHGVRTRVAFNTLIFTDELDAAEQQLRLLSRAGVDAVIVQDPGLARLAAEITPGLNVHASTQMTITSPEGVRFAEELGAKRIVLARELSLREIKKFEVDTPLEVFVHGALCVAYSGQCLTSESLGQRSANRGECAQACRMPYEMLVDGVPRDLGDRRYLLSPQDLAAVAEIPRLIDLGIACFKIEGRLKSPEYVAAVTQVYRKAIDAALEHRTNAVSTADFYQLEMTFSRGLFSGWLHGVNHQQLVSARFGKKRGPFAGHITRVGNDYVELDPKVSLQPGDGVVFDTGGDPDSEQGGRIYQVKNRRLFFKHRHIDFLQLKPGDRIWKTDDPALNSRLKKSFAGNIQSGHRKIPIDLRVSGKAGHPMLLHAAGIDPIASSIPLQAARTAPLTPERLREHLGRFSETPFELRTLEIRLEGPVILPIGELNRIRRELISRLEILHRTARVETGGSAHQNITRIIMRATEQASLQKSSLHLLCRSLEQVESALQCGVKSIYADFEDIRRYSEAVALVRTRPGAEILLATPRIQKAGEQGFFKLIENAHPDGVLIRNLGAIDYFNATSLRKIGDFSLNTANPLTAEYLIDKGLDRITVSYDLNIQQVLALLNNAPAGWFELTIHQHMPMFHMEHCVFAAFLSDGTDHTNCGRPCDRHRVHLRDRVGVAHPLRADVGCRNTLFNAVAQTGASFFNELEATGLRHYRIELLEESPEETRQIIQSYQSLLTGENAGETLWLDLKAHSQLGVTHGTYRTGEK